MHIQIAHVFLFSRECEFEILCYPIGPPALAYTASIPRFAHSRLCAAQPVCLFYYYWKFFLQVQLSRVGPSQTHGVPFETRQDIHRFTILRVPPPEKCNSKLVTGRGFCATRAPLSLIKCKPRTHSRLVRVQVVSLVALCCATFSTLNHTALAWAINSAILPLVCSCCPQRRLMPSHQFDMSDNAAGRDGAGAGCGFGLNPLTSSES